MKGNLRKKKEGGIFSLGNAVLNYHLPAYLPNEKTWVEMSHVIGTKPRSPKFLKSFNPQITFDLLLLLLVLTCLLSTNSS